MVVLDEEEILAEKVRAIVSRTKARDVYDFWFLLQEKTEINYSLIQTKLALCKKQYTCIASVLVGAALR